MKINRSIRGNLRFSLIERKEYYQKFIMWYIVEYKFNGGFRQCSIPTKDNICLFDLFYDIIATESTKLTIPVLPKLVIITYISRITVTACEGCAKDRPGQKDHMGPGGCLCSDM